MHRAGCSKHSKDFSVFLKSYFQKQFIDFACFQPSQPKPIQMLPTSAEEINVFLEMRMMETMMRMVIGTVMMITEMMMRMVKL